MNKSVYLGLAILKIRTAVLYVFWYGQVKPKYEKKANVRICCIKTKSNIYLIDDVDQKPQTTKRCAMKQNLKFKDYKICLEANQPKNEIKLLGKNDNEVDSLRENCK